MSFDDVQALFSEPGDYLEIFDEVHSADEDRFIAIGAISRGVIVVVYTEWDQHVVRIISARRATKREEMMYRAYTKGKRT